MSHLAFPANQESPISDALRRIRLRFDRPRWVGVRWVHVSVSQRAKNQKRELGGTTRRRDDPKRWQPDHGRISPREELLDDRRSRVRYAFAGWMRFYHGKGPPLVGRPRLYCWPEPLQSGAETGARRSRTSAEAAE